MLSNLNLNLNILTLTLTLALLILTPRTEATATTRPYKNTTFIGSHDAPFSGPLPQQNQNLNITAQLNLGIRFLQGQTHLSLDKSHLELCHSSCLLEDGGPLVDFLTLVKTWLDGEGQGEVVTLLLTNGDNVDVGMFADAFVESGLDQVAFVPESAEADTEWPGVEEMVEMEKRVVVFLGASFPLSCLVHLVLYGVLPAPYNQPASLIQKLDYNANATQTPYILDEFSHYFETPFDVTDGSFPNCSIDRPTGINPDNRMYIVNHFLDVEILGIKVPDRAHASRTNAVHGDGSIMAQAQLCAGLYGRVPNVVLLDFVDQGGVIEAQELLNRYGS